MASSIGEENPKVSASSVSILGSLFIAMDICRLDTVILFFLILSLISMADGVAASLHWVCERVWLWSSTAEQSGASYAVLLATLILL